ncbi:ion transporter [Altericroceibacterium spongiae]|uniref:Ion transporter n=1 Tax=Altericroceibacterium spongiae TaxID=2320269 RepID=A0A420EM78_9SPHN|nr:ion transporter [Altericroceibacterium spongiae]RKF21750.1 ion transporter [Altericroceibacterium spongiae]
MRKLRRYLYLQLHIGHTPDGRLTRLNLALIIIILAAIVVAIIGTEPSIASGREGLTFWVEVFFGIVFGLEYCARLWSVTEKRGKAPAWKKRLRFALSPLGLIDLAVVLATLSPTLVTNAAIFRSLRIFRMVVSIKESRFSHALKQLQRAMMERGYDFLVIIAIAGTVLLIAATALFWAEGDVQPEAFGSVPRALWWAIITVTTIGYGDVTPITPLGKIFASLVALSSVMLVAMPTGIVAAAFSDAMRRHRRTMAQKPKPQESEDHDT